MIDRFLIIFLSRILHKVIKILFLQGEPFMESLTANRPLLYSVLLSGGAVFALALGLMPDLSHQFEIVPFPHEVFYFIAQYLID
jgi:manganese-transporting P-type ATPase